MCVECAVCFYVCCSDCVGICWNICTIVADMQIVKIVRV